MVCEVNGGRCVVPFCIGIWIVDGNLHWHVHVHWIHSGGRFVVVVKDKVRWGVFLLVKVARLKVTISRASPEFVVQPYGFEHLAPRLQQYHVPLAPFPILFLFMLLR